MLAVNLFIISLDGKRIFEKMDIKNSRKAYMSKKGFTLVEILLSLAIFTILIVLAAQALNQIMKTYYRRDIIENGDNIEYLKNFWVRTSIEGMLDYMVRNNRKKWVPFFKGDTKTFKYVTSVPMVNVFPVMCEIRLQDESGIYRIVYFEQEVLTKTYKEMKKIFEKWRKKKIEPVVIAKDIKDVSISYLGATRRSSKVSWHDRYDSFKTGELPLAIRLKYKFKGKPVVYRFRIYHRGFLKSNYNDLFKKKK